MVIATALGVVGDWHTAADAAQESLVKSYVRLGDLRSRGQFGPWLNRIARNTARDFRKQRRAGSLPSDPPAGRAEPAGGQDELVRQAVALVGRLPDHERVVVELFYLQEMTVAQTAQTIGRSVSTVTKQLSRARRRLRQWMDGVTDET